MKSKGRKLFIDATVITATSLVIRLIAFAFQVWLVERVGSDGIGLFQLVMSVSAFASTLAISGVSYAAVRLISIEIGRGHPEGVGRAVKCCTAYALLFGLFSSSMVLICSNGIALFALGDVRTAAPMRLLAVSLPLISVLTVLQGYFTAVGRVCKNAIVHVSEQVLRVVIIASLVYVMPPGNIERACTLIVAGGVASEVLSFLIMLALYAADRAKHGVRGKSRERFGSRVLKTAMPVAVISYTETALSMLQNLLIPGGLLAAGFTRDAALSGYGIIQGMVMPIVYFPSCVLFSISDLIVPDMTEAQVNGNRRYISRITATLLARCLIYATGIAGLIYTLAGELSAVLYGSAEAAPYLRTFALILPVMYMSMMTDGLLRGLGQQTYMMIYGIATAALSTIAIKVFLPVYALDAYVVIFALTESASLALGLIRLSGITGFQLSAQRVVFPAICAVGAFCSARVIVLNILHQPLAALVLSIAAGCVIYAGLIYLINLRFASPAS